MWVWSRRYAGTLARDGGGARREGEGGVEGGVPSDLIQKVLKIKKNVKFSAFKIPHYYYFNVIVKICTCKNVVTIFFFLDTVEPLYSGHHWGMKCCPL